MHILGISAYYHDSAAALLKDGKLVAAAQEERFTRKKHDSGFPREAVRYCLAEAGIDLSEVEFVTFYDKPLLKFERLLETYLAFAPKGFRSYIKALPVWLKDKLHLRSVLRKEFSDLSGLTIDKLPQLLFSEHHQSHAASAFFPSPFEEAAVLCLDGVGEWATTSAWIGKGHQLHPQWEIHFPHSLGMLYSAFTYFAGFKVNSGEYKLMGLAPYGEPRYAETILNHLMDLKEDGTFRLDLKYFDFAAGLRMTNQRFADLFGGPPRKPESAVTQREMDLARSIQMVTEEIVLRLARTLHQETDLEYLCLAGGVALNCVANGRLLKEGPFKDLWIQPAAGDAGGSVGAALATWHQYLDNPRRPEARRDGMKGGYLGPSQSQSEIEVELTRLNARFHVAGPELFELAARLLEEGNVLGWVQDRMEFGPRALGNRSIIGDSRNRKMQSIMNLKIKFRESFRPFAPAVLAEDVSMYFDLDRPSPYMLLVSKVNERWRTPVSEEDQKLFGIEKLNVSRSTIPAVTHVDYSARVQTVHEETNPKFHGLLKEFKKRTGCPVLINTSFNVRGEPIVRTAADAYRCFMRTDMDYLIVGQCVMAKKDQPAVEDNKSWIKEFGLD